MARKLDPCPICGATCHRIGEGVVCTEHWRKEIDGKWRESGCPYEAPDLRAHEAISARLAEKPKRGRVLARGWFCPREKNAGVQGDGPHLAHMVLPRACFCEQGEPCFKGCQRVLIVRAGKGRKSDG